MCIKSTLYLHQKSANFAINVMSKITPLEGVVPTSNFLILRLDLIGCNSNLSQIAPKKVYFLQIIEA